MARLSLALLGPMQVKLDGHPVAGFESAKVRALLAYLALETDCPHNRDELACLLWPDEPDQAARANLRNALGNLRQAITDPSARPPFLSITRDTIQFNVESDYSLDVDQFIDLVTACRQHAHRRIETCRSCAQRLQAAVELYGGDLLSQLFLNDSPPFEEWLLVKREQLHRQVLDALFRLASCYERRGDYERARQYAARQLELDSWREEAHRQAMRALALGGQRSAALAQYKTCRRALAEELGAEPAAETTALYEQIKSGPLNPEHPPYNLPVLTTSFVGREKELGEIVELLENPICRLVTIVGPGGVGKTRLALAAAMREAEDGTFAHGVYFVPLASSSSSQYLVPAIADALHLTLTGRPDPQAELFSYLRGKELLLVLDSLEHLLDGAGLITKMLCEASQVICLVTSRERLALQSEWPYDLPGLSYPSSGSVEYGDNCSAVQLFAQRAHQASSHFSLSPDELPAVVRICQLVKGMPLAIELAAASTCERTCAEIAADIERNARILSIEYRDVPERHRSMWATFEHSWKLLTPEEQTSLQRLSIFRGGFSPEAATKVSGATPDVLTALTDKSLLQRAPRDRFDMHELVRQYADDKLRASHEHEQVQRQHLDYFLQLAVEAEAQLIGPAQKHWLDCLECENDNLRAALGWVGERGEAEWAAQLAAALPPFWERHGHLREGRRWLAMILEHPEQLAAATYAKVLDGAGFLAFAQGDQAEAQTLHEKSLNLFRSLNDRSGIALCLFRLGGVLKWRGDYAGAEALLEESQQLFQAMGNRWGVAKCLFQSGLVAAEHGEHARSAALYETSLALLEEVGDVWSIAVGFNNRANIAHEAGDWPRAQQLHEKSLALFRELGDKDSIAMSLNNLATDLRQQGNLQRAQELALEGLRIRYELGNRRGLAYCLETLADVSAAQGRAAHAARLCGAIEALRESIGAPRPPSEHLQFQHRVVAVIQAQVDGAEFERNCAEGRTMTLEQAIAYAQANDVDPKHTSRSLL